MANTGNNPSTSNQGGSQQAGQAAKDIKNRAQEAASGVAQKAQETGSNIAQRAQDFASGAAQKTQDAMSTVGEQISSFAGTIRERVPHEGMLGTAASTVADSLEAGGQYLQEHDLNDLTQELNHLVRRYPWQSLLAGLGVGFLIGQTFSRR